MIRLPVEPLTAEAFAPYGRVVERPSRSEDAAGPGWRWWAETAYLAGDGRQFGVGYLDLWPADGTFDWAERHLRTQEAVFATSADLLVYVAPADHPEEPARLPGPDRFRVFRVPPGSGVVMDRAVWHGAPLADPGAGADPGGHGPPRRDHGPVPRRAARDRRGGLSAWPRSCSTT
jgi:ureidoglycolate lyase